MAFAVAVSATAVDDPLTRFCAACVFVAAAFCDAWKRVALAFTFAANDVAVIELPMTVLVILNANIVLVMLIAF